MIIKRKGNTVTDEYTHNCYVLNNKHDAIMLENTLNKYYDLLTLLKNINFNTYLENHKLLMELQIEVQSV